MSVEPAGQKSDRGMRRTALEGPARIARVKQVIMTINSLSFLKMGRVADRIVPQNSIDQRYANWLI